MKRFLVFIILLHSSLTFATTLRFAVVSDLNGSYGSTQYSSSVKKAIEAITSEPLSVDFVLSTGDMVAGQKSGLDYQAMWNGFHQTVTDPILNKEIPIFPSPGNHDAYASRPIERKFYRDNWLKKNNPLTSLNFAWVQDVEQNYPFQYAFKVGQGLFISLDNTDVAPWSEKTVSWMEKVLKQETSSSFKIIYGHVPLLPFAFKKETEYVARGDKVFLEKVEKLFETYKVSAFLSGHSHVYYPGRRDAYTRFISVPLLGSGSRHLISNQKRPLSRTAFLIFEFDDSNGHWTLDHHAASDLSLIQDSEFPKVIELPKNNSGLCSGCKNFPIHQFLDPNLRIIYRRQDI